MRLLTQADDDLWRNLTFSRRMNCLDALENHLREKYETYPSDAEASFAYGFYCLEQANYAEAMLDKHSYFVEMLESLGNALKQNPDHWLARYFRATALTFASYNEFPIVPGISFPGKYGPSEATQDLYFLIEEQAKLAPQPYFICPYVILAQKILSEGQPNEAVTLLEQGLQHIHPQSIRYMAEVLHRPFLLIIPALKKAGKNEMAQKLASAAKQFFFS